MYEGEDEIVDGIFKGCASRPVKICKKEDKKKVKKRRTKVACKLVNIQVNERVYQNENLVLERCPGCHHDHFRFPKFCRWWKTRKTTRKAAKQSVNTKLNEDPVFLEKCIESLEDRLNGTLDNYDDAYTVKHFF